MGVSGASSGAASGSSSSARVTAVARARPAHVFPGTSSRRTLPGLALLRIAAENVSPIRANVTVNVTLDGTGRAAVLAPRIEDTRSTSEAVSGQSWASEPRVTLR
jgi:hypothetical protein